MDILIHLDDELAEQVTAQAAITCGGNVHALIRLCLLQSLNPQQFQQEVQAYAPVTRD